MLYRAFGAPLSFCSIAFVRLCGNLQVQIFFIIKCSCYILLMLDILIPKDVSDSMLLNCYCYQGQKFKSMHYSYYCFSPSVILMSHVFNVSRNRLYCEFQIEMHFIIEVFPQTLALQYSKIVGNVLLRTTSSC